MTAKLMQTQLKKYGLSAKSMASMGLSFLTLNQCMFAVRALCPGIMIPYYDADKAKTAAYNVRLLPGIPDARRPGKTIKYKYPAAQAPSVYIPPIGNFSWRKLFADTQIPLHITEGEFKAAVATQHGYPTLGLPGVWGFRDPGSKTQLLSQLNDIVWEGRTVYIVYDSDTTTKPGVQMARSVLAGMLAQRGATVHCINLPQTGDEKVGLDDYINSAGADYNALLKTEETELSVNLALISSQFVYIRNPSCYLNISNDSLIGFHKLKEEVFAGLRHTDYAPDGKSRAACSLSVWNTVGGPRVELDGITFDPGQGPITDDNRYNMFHGFDSVPERGDTAVFQELLDWSIPDKKIQGHLLDIMAHVVQYPAVKLAVEVLLYSPDLEGVGKDMILDFLYAITRPYSSTLTEDDLVDTFTSHFAGRVVAIIGECGATKGNDTRRVTAKRKQLVTNPRLQYNEKGKPKYEASNYVNLFNTSNESVPIRQGSTSRRTFAVKFDQAPLSEELAARVSQYLNGGSRGDLKGVGIAQVHAMLLDRDLTSFNPNARAVVTEALEELREFSTSVLSTFAKSVKTGEVLFVRLPKERQYATLEELLALYNTDKVSGVSTIAMSRELSTAGVKRACGGMQAVLPDKTVARLWCIGTAPHDLSKSETGIRYAAQIKVAHTPVAQLRKVK